MVKMQIEAAAIQNNATRVFISPLPSPSPAQPSSAAMWQQCSDSRQQIHNSAQSQNEAQSSNCTPHACHLIENSLDGKREGVRFPAVVYASQAPKSPIRLRREKIISPAASLLEPPTIVRQCSSYIKTASPRPQYPCEASLEFPSGDGTPRCAYQRGRP